MHIRLSEHKQLTVISINNGVEEYDHERGVLRLLPHSFNSLVAVRSKSFNNSSFCFSTSKVDDNFNIKADYCIGIDWLGESGKCIFVEPKINTYSATRFDKLLQLGVEGDKLDIGGDEQQVIRPIYNATPYRQLDYVKMLLDVMSLSESAECANDLVRIDWNAPHITIEQKEDHLTPFIVVQFLHLLKAIVRKGLKKSYYTVHENLTNRVKGRIVISTHIKQNVFKNRFTKTFCTYQSFGIDSIENRFIKKVFSFVISYVETHRHTIFHSNIYEIEALINYCRPAFELISDDVQEIDLKHFKPNPFYKEYKPALKIGGYILKRFGYNISQATSQIHHTPPFWIDMPKLFELYFYCQLLKANPADKQYIHFQFSTYGNSLDLLITKPGYEMVIDVKYKLHYNYSQVHQDIRQVAGYARLTKVLKRLGIIDGRGEQLYIDGIPKESVVDCLIIYPIMNEPESKALTLESIKMMMQPIEAYHNVYKLGISFPIITD